MSVKRLASVLGAFSELIAESGDAHGRDEIRAVVALLSSVGDGKLSTLVAKVKRHWLKISRRPAYPSRLAVLLKRLEVLLLASGAVAVAKDLLSFQSLFAGSDSASGDEFARDIKAAVFAPAPMKKAKVAARPPLSETEARRYAEALTQSSVKRDVFEAELQAILEIPKLKTDEFRQIAERFLGFPPAKSKNAILKQLRTRQDQDALDASRDRRIQKIAV